MKRLSILWLLILFLAAASQASALVVEKIGDDANRITVVYLKGTPYELGYIHGSSCKTEIKAFYEKILAEAENKITGASVLLDIAYKQMEPYISQAYKEEMQGLADGAGLPLESVQRVHAIPDLSEYHCTFFAAWGNATADGNLYQIRALDYAMDIHLQEYPAILVYEPENGLRFVNVGWLGFIGVISGMNYQGISVSEIGEHFGDEHETLAGEPMPFVLRDILQGTDQVSEAVDLIKNAQRTSSYLYCVGDAKAKNARSFKTASDIFEVYTPETSPVSRLQSVVYFSMGVGSSWNTKVYQYLQPRYGQITAETGASLMRDLKTGNVHAVVYDFAHRQVQVANASPGMIPGHDRTFVTYHLDRADTVFAHYEATVVPKRSNDGLPASTVLMQSYPNPFNPITSIVYELATDGEAEIRVFDMLGHPVATLFKGFQAAGRHQVKWEGRDDNGKDLPSGIYICRLKSNQITKTIKLLRIR